MDRLLRLLRKLEARVKEVALDTFKNRYIKASIYSGTILEEWQSRSSQFHHKDLPPELGTPERLALQHYRKTHFETKYGGMYSRQITFP